jgi:transposase-like protein
MICSRCKKNYTDEPMTPLEWFKSQKQLDSHQLRFIKDNYDYSLCADCIRILKDSFYIFSINPSFRFRKKHT